MKKYELQKLVESDPNTKYEHWRPLTSRISSDDIETLKQFMAEDHRIVEIETGKEIMRYKIDK
jgi:hypothetical protein